MRRCCFKLIRLRPAAIIIGLLGILFALASIAIICYILCKLSAIIEDLRRQGDEEFRCMLIYICVWYLIVAVLTIFISILLIMGSVQPKAALVLPWLILSILAVLFTGFNLLLLMATFSISIVYCFVAWVCAVLGCLIFAYFWCVIRSLYRRLKKKESEEAKAAKAAG